MRNLLGIEASHTAQVILLHGLARSHYSMGKMAKALRQAGYFTVNQGYPSTKYPVSELAEMAINKALARCAKDATIHL